MEIVMIQCYYHDGRKQKNDTKSDLCKQVKSSTIQTINTIIQSDDDDDDGHHGGNFFSPPFEYKETGLLFFHIQFKFL